MDKERARRLFLTAFFLFALANGLSGSIISNYFKDVFQVDSVQRGLLEIPRELPGVVGVFVIAALPSLGNVSLSVLGFALYCVGLLVLGNIFQQLYNAVDSMIVGNFVGKEALAAVTSSSPIINLLISFFMGLSTEG